MLKAAGATSQSILFALGGNVNYSSQPITLLATATSGLPVTFRVVSGSAMVSGDMLTITGTGVITVGADQSGDATYAAAPEIQRTFYVNHANQTIPPFEIPGQVYGVAPFALIAPTVSSVGLPINYAIMSGPATLSGNTITLTGTGTVKVKATQAGDTLYSAANPVIEQFTVTSAPVVTSVKAEEAFIGRPYSYQVTATGPPSGYTLTGTLPNGLIFNSLTGVISGTPTQLGTFHLTVGATLFGGTGLQNVTLQTVANVPYLLVLNDAGTVSQYTMTGKLTNPTLIQGLSGTEAFAVADGFIYVATLEGESTIRKYTTAGKLVDAAFITGLNYVTSLSVWESNLYVLDAQAGTVSAYSTAGTVVKAPLITKLVNATSLLAENSDLYISDYYDNVINHYTTSGVKVKAPFVQGLAGPEGMTISGPDLYVVNSDIGTIGEYLRSSGATVATIFATQFDDPFAMATLGNTLFIESGNYTIGTYSTSGMSLSPFLLQGLHGALNFAIDSSAYDQTLTYTPALANTTYPHAPIHFTATASSGLPVTVTVVSGPATISGNVLTLTGTGTVELKAVQSGGLTANPLTVTGSFNVTAP